MSADDLDGLPLLPDEGDSVTPDEELDAAASGVFDAMSPARIVPDVPQPFGRTPLFDFETGRFKRVGGSPVFVTGHAALEQLCSMVLHSARYAHAVFTDDFGMEEPDSVIGEAADAAEAAADWGERAQEALVAAHERIAGIEDFNARYVPEEGVVYIDSFTVVTDEDDYIDLGGLAVPVGVTDDGN